MRELKTLKGLRKGNLKVPYILMEGKIRQEALRWIRESRKNPATREFMRNFNNGWEGALMSFHNITEMEVRTQSGDSGKVEE